MANTTKKILDEAGVKKSFSLIKDMIEEHTEDNGIHVTSTDKANLSAATAHAQQAHAPSTAEKNVIVTIKKNGTALTPDSSRAVNITVPTKVSELTNDSSYATTSSVTSSVNSHNTDTSAHSDIRNLITTINTRLNAALDSDDTTLDQMSEIVTYIKNNKSLIDSVTTSKINTSDIVDNLTTNVTTKVLAASQGVAIKALIDALQTAVDGKAASGHTHSNYASTVTTTGTGNAVTSITQSGNTITATKGATFLTAHPTITKSTDSTSTATPTHAGVFTAIDSVTRDTNGHVTKVNTKTVTLPSETKLSKGTNATKSTVLKHAGTFAVVTGTSVSNHVVTDTVTTFSLPTDYDFGSLD